MTNPFTAYTPEQIEGLPEVSDVVREWEAVKRTLAERWDTGNVGPIDVEVIADAMAAELVRLRAMVAALESETVCPHRFAWLAPLRYECQTCGGIYEITVTA